jgi:protein-arginine kinase activator protein McsA
MLTLTSTSTSTSTKICRNCNSNKPITDFNPWDKSNDGLSGLCKICSKKKSESNQACRKRLSERTLVQLAADIIKTYGDVKIATKKCTKCHQIKHLSQFGIDRYLRSGVKSWCITCWQQYQADEYDQRSQFKASQRDGQICTKCGFEDSRCLDFAHYDHSEKFRNDSGNTVSPAQLSLNQLRDEVEKTRLLCKNCHAEETYNETSSHLSHHPDAIRGRNRTNILREIVNTEKLVRCQCVDCGLKVENSNYHLFDFDHNPAYPKVAAIAQMVGGFYPKTQIIEEMMKCDLRCKNCHYLMTLKRGQLGTFAPKNSQNVLDLIGHLI